MKDKCPAVYSAQRDKALRFMDSMKEAVDSSRERASGLSPKMLSSLPIEGRRLLTGKDPETLAITENIFAAFEELDKYFIAPLALTNPAVAKLGYEKLALLMTASFAAARYKASISFWMGLLADQIWAHAKQAIRGRKSGAARRENRKWVPHAEELAHQLRGEDGGASAPDIAAEIHAGWKLADPELPAITTLTAHIRQMIRAGTLAPAIAKKKD